MADQNQRWTEIEHLPEWDEEFYHIYTAKKFGKWVMIKTLRPEFKDLPEYQEMIEREFDTRYNLAHPNIVMINDSRYRALHSLRRCLWRQLAEAHRHRQAYRPSYRADAPPACGRPGVYPGQPYSACSSHDIKYYFHGEYRQSQAHRRGFRAETIS